MQEALHTETNLLPLRPIICFSSTALNRTLPCRTLSPIMVTRHLSQIPDPPTQDIRTSQRPTRLQHPVLHNLFAPTRHPQLRVQLQVVRLHLLAHSHTNPPASSCTPTWRKWCLQMKGKKSLNCPHNTVRRGHLSPASRPQHPPLSQHRQHRQALPLTLLRMFLIFH